MKRAVKELTKAPQKPVQSDKLTRARMDLEHALIAAGGPVLASRAVVLNIDRLIAARLEEILEP